MSENDNLVPEAPKVTPKEDAVPAAVEPTEVAPPPKDTLFELFSALENFIDWASIRRREDLEAATKRAGGNRYNAENKGFDTRKYDIITKAEDFLKALRTAVGG